MGRWQPDARGRLERAAMELFTERGYDQTTVAEIAQRAGLTERTFFRHYADKREVLFAGASGLQDLMVTALADSPAGASPMEAMGASLDAVADLFQDLREFASARQVVITGNAELRERELIKLATLADALADTLRARGVREPAASLTAEAGIAVFKIAFERWVGGGPDLRARIHEALTELRSVTGS